MRARDLRAARRVLARLRPGRPRPSPTLAIAAYLAPASLALAATGAWLARASGWGKSPVQARSVALGGGAVLLGTLAGALAGAREQERFLDDLDHDLRMPMTIIRGEVELVLSQDDVAAEERRRSSLTVIDQVERLQELLRRRYR